MEKEVKKIHIGCGKKRFKGYLNIDVEEQYKPDLVADFRKLNFKDLEVIRNYHLLEHFPREEAINIIKLWASWLKKDGLLIIETPDFEGICEMFISDHKRRDWLIRHTYGSQDFQWALHQDGWYEDKFRNILPECGFCVENIERIKGSKKLPNIKVVAIKQ